MYTLSSPGHGAREAEGARICSRGRDRQKIKIKKNVGWCDDPNSNFYNKEITLPTKFSHEKLYRKDNLYDLIVVLDYNMQPIKKNKGSAIFIHIANKFYKKTKGCIALKKGDLIKMLSQIKRTTKIKIY